MILVVSLHAGGEQVAKTLTLDAIVVEESSEFDDATTSATEGVVPARQLAIRPILRPAEVLESVPGLIVTQHSGDGKANQYFLRGFSLDHGTDFSTTVEGVPTNLSTHAHGQGYNDLNFLIPELIADVAYKKGPYFASEGDFSSTGSAAIHYLDSLSSGIASITAGSFGQKRLFNAKSFDVGGGKLLYGFEYFHNDGPWEQPENYQRFNGVLSYAKSQDDSAYKITAMGYKGDWDATDQVPLRAIQSGAVGRFGSLDASDGGDTHRYSLSGEYAYWGDGAATTAKSYIVNYSLDLYSNYTYFLDNPAQGDQFEQKDDRTIVGGSVERAQTQTLFGLNTTHTFGAQFRNDIIDGVGLYNTQNRVRFNTITSHDVNIATLGLYYQNELKLNDYTRMITGLRSDLYQFDVQDTISPVNSNVVTDSITSPKLNFIFGPWSDTELFVNAGYGFHSNDARGIAASVDPATPLVRTKGAEIGARTHVVKDLQASLALWVLHSDSELVFVGDAGGTEPTDAAKRTGTELSLYWTPTSWFILDADISLSRARYDDPASAGGAYVPQAIEKTVSIGAAITEYDNYFAGIRARYFGSRALIEDNSIRSEPSTLLNLKAGRHLSKNVDLSLDVYNVLDTQNYDIEYYYESQLANESTPVADHVVHPTEPRSVRLSLTYRY